MRLRLVVFASDGRGARNVEFGPGKLALVIVAALAVVGCVLWVGWKIGELTARF